MQTLASFEIQPGMPSEPSAPSSSEDDIARIDAWARHARAANGFGDTVSGAATHGRGDVKQLRPAREEAGADPAVAGGTL